MLPAGPEILFSVITPSAGVRPRGLSQAIASVEAAVARAWEEAGLDPARTEMLVGFDAVEGERRSSSLVHLRYVTLPRPEGVVSGFGNHVRNTLLRGARGRFLLFVDDDNALTDTALLSYLPHLGAEFIVARVDTSRAFAEPFLPRPAPAGVDPITDAVRPGNIDPLCLCVSRELAFVRCRGWASEGGYESDFLNIRRYHLRAKSAVRIDDVVGVYDAGRGLDAGGLNPRQQRLGQDPGKP